MVVGYITILKYGDFYLYHSVSLYGNCFNIALTQKNIKYLYNIR